MPVPLQQVNLAKLVRCMLLLQPIVLRASYHSTGKCIVFFVLSHHLLCCLQVGRGYQVTATLLKGVPPGIQNLTAAAGKTISFWRADSSSGSQQPRRQHALAIGEQFATAVTDANGQATVTVPSMPEPGSSIVVAMFEGSASRYKAEAARIDWLPADNNTVTGPNITITTPDTDIAPGQGVEVTVVSVDAAGNPVPNTTVTVDVNGTATPQQLPRIGRQQAPRVMQTYTFQSDEKGEVRLRISSSSAGTSIITASYVIAGSVFSTSFSLTWTDPPTIISLSPRKQVLPYGRAAELLATVTDTAGTPLSNVPVNFGLSELSLPSYPYVLNLKDQALQVSIQAAEDTDCNSWPTTDANGRAVIWVASPQRPGDYLVGVGTRCQKNALGISVVSDYAFVKWVGAEDKHGYHRDDHDEGEDELEHRHYSHDGHRDMEEHYEDDWEHRDREHRDYEDDREHRDGDRHQEERYGVDLPFSQCV